MTATLAPAEVSAIPSRLTISSHSYWDSLKRDERLASINEHKSRKLGRKTGWFPDGVVLKRWTEEIYPTITTIINDAGNYEKIFGRHNQEGTRPCWLYMVGEGGQWMTARPTIVALCSKTRIAQRICDLLRNIECMRALNLGFDYMAHKERVILVAGEDHIGSVSNSTSTDLGWNLCGFQVLASTYPPSLSAKWKEATAGGTLKIDEEYYCLTVAHAFHLPVFSFADDGSDSSMDLSESSDCSDDIYPISDLHPSGSVLTCPPEMLDDQDLGLYRNLRPERSASHFRHGTQINCAPTAVTDVELICRGRDSTLETPTSQPLLLSKETDWALLRIEQPRFFNENLVHTPSGKILSPQKISSSPPDGKVIVAAGTSGVFESNCPGLVGGLLLPGCTQMIDVWTIDSLCCKIFPALL